MFLFSAAIFAPKPVRSDRARRIADRAAQLKPHGRSHLAEYGDLGSIHFSDAAGDGLFQLCRQTGLAAKVVTGFLRTSTVFQIKSLRLQGSFYRAHISKKSILASAASKAIFTQEGFGAQDQLLARKETLLQQDYGEASPAPGDKITEYYILPEGVFYFLGKCSQVHALIILG